jgi:hypothetical protein
MHYVYEPTNSLNGKVTLHSLRVQLKYDGHGASTWVVTLHNLFLYSDPPLPCHPPWYWLRVFSSQTFSRTNTPTFSNLVILHTYPPMKMEQTVFRNVGI